MRTRISPMLHARTRRYHHVWLRALVACIVASATALPAISAGQRPPGVESAAAEISVELALQEPVPAQIYATAHNSVVVDLPGASPGAIKSPGHGTVPLIASTRIEPLAPNGARLVLETSAPVELTAAHWATDTAGRATVPPRLQLNIRPLDAAANRTAAPPPEAELDSLFQRAVAQSGQTGGTATPAEEGLPVKPAVFDDDPSAPAAPPAPAAKPVIMIDAGHGGIDPGAIGPSKITEKTIVLAVAQELKSILDATGRYDARLTRATDVFIPLDKRVELSRQAQASVFVSLHADTIDNRQLAQSIRGASVYTLSEKASNEEARIMAEKENAADLIGGVATKTEAEDDALRPILADLMARETATFSKLLSRSVVGALAKATTLAHEPERAAAFRVLRSSEHPSVLIELGFLSNSGEEQTMSTATWQRKVAKSIAAALEAYFAQKGSSVSTGPLNGLAGGLPP